MAQVVHRPAIFDDEERYPFGNVLCKQYPYPESQGESFYDPEDPVENLFVAGRGFVVGDVSKEVPHSLIFSRNGPHAGFRTIESAVLLRITRLQGVFHSASASAASGRSCAPRNGIVGKRRGL